MDAAQQSKQIGEWLQHTLTPYAPDLELIMESALQGAWKDGFDAGRVQGLAEAAQMVEESNPTPEKVGGIYKALAASIRLGK